MNQISLLVSNTPIRQDAEDRFCLNDLHQASGGTLKHKPANFLRLDSTNELVEEINRCSEMRNAINVKQGGTNQGTFVVKELVYAYAMWISAKFHLQVIRAYDALVTSSPAQPSNPTPNPVTLDEFKNRHLELTSALQTLLDTPITMTYKEVQLLKKDPQTVAELIIKLAKDGLTRSEIVVAIGKTSNNVKQVLYHARKNGVLTGNQGVL
jgi:hypothetical protein